MSRLFFVHLTRSSQILLRCQPLSWFIDPPAFFMRWMCSASLTFLLPLCCSFPTIIASQCTSCPVTCACSAIADLSTRPILVSALCSLILWFAVLFVYTCVNLALLASNCVYNTRYLTLFCLIFDSSHDKTFYSPRSHCCAYSQSCQYAPNSFACAPDVWYRDRLLVLFVRSCLSISSLLAGSS